MPTFCLKQGVLYRTFRNSDEADKAPAFLKKVASEKSKYIDCSDAKNLAQEFAKIAKETTEIVTEFKDITLIDTLSSVGITGRLAIGAGTVKKVYYDEMI